MFLFTIAVGLHGDRATPYSRSIFLGGRENEMLSLITPHFHLMARLRMHTVVLLPSRRLPGEMPSYGETCTRAFVGVRA
jgi:hypothetical protein